MSGAAESFDEPERDVEDFTRVLAFAGYSSCQIEHLVAPVAIPGIA